MASREVALLSQIEGLMEEFTSMGESPIAAEVQRSLDECIKPGLEELRSAGEGPISEPGAEEPPMPPQHKGFDAARKQAGQDWEQEKSEEPEGEEPEGEEEPTTKKRFGSRR